MNEATYRRALHELYHLLPRTGQASVLERFKNDPDILSILLTTPEAPSDGAEGRPARSEMKKSHTKTGCDVPGCKSDWAIASLRDKKSVRKVCAVHRSIDANMFTMRLRSTKR